MGQLFQTCAGTTFDVGPGVIQIALQIITLASIYLGVTRLQSAVQGQQSMLAARLKAEKRD